MPVQFRGDLFVDTLRAKLVTARLGATILNDLTGPVEIPKRSDIVEAAWVAEDIAIGLSDPTFSQLTMTPRTIAARTELTRNLLMQSSPDAEQLVRNDLASVMAEGDRRGRHQRQRHAAVPRGVLNFVGIGTSTWPR